MQGIEAVGSRIGEIEGRMADLGLRPAGAPGTAAATGPAGAGASGATVDPATDAAFQGLLQAKTAQLATLTGDGSGTSVDISALAGLTGASGLGGMPGLPGTTGLPGASAGGVLPTDAMTMLQRLGLDRSALASSSVASLTALAGTAPASPAALTPASPVAATAGVTGVRNAKGVPADLAAYGNGKVPAAALAELPGAAGHRLWAPAADAFTRMKAAAAADGVSFGITDSYRPLSVQQDLVARKGLYKNGGLAAVPGTSQHGWGTAVDLKLGSEAQAWMRTNGPRFGFVEDTPREPWHWTYKG